MSAFGPSISLTALKTTFDKYDKYKVGSISVPEFKEYFLSHGTYVDDSSIIALLRKYDIDHNGRIDFNEFCRLVNGDSTPVTPINRPSATGFASVTTTQTTATPMFNSQVPPFNPVIGPTGYIKKETLTTTTAPGANPIGTYNAGYDEGFKAGLRSSAGPKMTPAIAHAGYVPGSTAIAARTSQYNQLLMSQVTPGSPMLQAPMANLAQSVAPNGLPLPPGFPAQQMQQVPYPRNGGPQPVLQQAGVANARAYPAGYQQVVASPQPYANRRSMPPGYTPVRVEAQGQVVEEFDQVAPGYHKHTTVAHPAQYQVDYIGDERLIQQQSPIMRREVLRQGPPVQPQGQVVEEFDQVAPGYHKHTTVSHPAQSPIIRRDVARQVAPVQPVGRVVEEFDQVAPGYHQHTTVSHPAQYPMTEAPQRAVQKLPPIVRREVVKLDGTVVETQEEYAPSPVHPQRRVVMEQPSPVMERRMIFEEQQSPLFATQRRVIAEQQPSPIMAQRRVVMEQPQSPMHFEQPPMFVSQAMTPVHGQETTTEYVGDQHFTTYVPRYAEQLVTKTITEAVPTEVYEPVEATQPVFAQHTRYF